ncbi:MAG: lysylphosphatidylglycerol synthase transmembrane domain-containing protein [Planctomycetota bacterium]
MSEVSAGKKWGGRVLKILVLVGVVGFVLSNVQWSDRLELRGESGEFDQFVEGSIDGPWDAEVVHFIPSEGEDVDVGREEKDRAVTPGLATYLQQLDWFYFAGGALCYLVTLIVASSRWCWLLRANGLKVGLLEAIRLTWIGVFFNNIVPGQTGGDLVKAIYIVRRCPEGRVEAGMSVVVDRILGLGSLALLGAIVVLFQLERFAEIAVGMWIVLAGVSVIGSFAFSRKIRRGLKLDQRLRKLPPKLSGPLMKVDAAIYSYHEHRNGVLVWLVLGSLNHVATISSFWLMGEALGVGLDPIDYFAIMPVVLMGSAVPILPAGWGVGELLTGEMFARFGAGSLAGPVADPEAVMRTRGVALSVLYRVHLTVWSLVGGLMLLLDKNRVEQHEVREQAAQFGVEP